MAVVNENKVLNFSDLKIATTDGKSLNPLFLATLNELQEAEDDPSNKFGKPHDGMLNYVPSQEGDWGPGLYYITITNHVVTRNLLA